MSAVVFMILTEKDLPSTLSPEDKDFILSYQHEYNARIAEEKQRLKAWLEPTLTAEIIQGFDAYKFPKLQLTHNPTNLSNPYWQWIIEQKLYPNAILAVIPQADENLYQKRHFGEASPTDVVPPVWCFDRIGQTSTLLPDGREILIGGEYDDFYDPNFCIYNDVVVKHPSGRIEIFGYPLHVFPPTDFHTATLIGNKIYIIGSMGYFDQRHYSETPIFTLDTNTMQIHRIESRNHIGWINEHQAMAKDGQIIVSGGRVFDDDHSPMRENFDTWSFNPKTLIWKNITNHQWQVFWITRKDLADLTVSRYNTIAYYQGKFDDYDLSSELEHFEQALGEKPNLKLYRQLFRPPLEHTIVTDSEKMVGYSYDTFVIDVEGIKVRYVTDSNFIQVYVEGRLSEEKLELLQENLRHKLSRLENHSCEIKNIFV